MPQRKIIRLHSLLVVAALLVATHLDADHLHDHGGGAGASGSWDEPEIRGGGHSSYTTCSIGNPCSLYAATVKDGGP